MTGIVFEAYYAPDEGAANFAGLNPSILATDKNHVATFAGLAATITAGELASRARFAGLSAGVFGSDVLASAVLDGLHSTVFGSGYPIPEFAVAAFSGIDGDVVAHALKGAHGSPSFAGLTASLLATNKNHYASFAGLDSTVFADDFDRTAHAIFAAFQTPGYVYGLGGTPTNLLQDGIGFGDSHSAQGVLALLDAIAFGVTSFDIVSLPVAIAVSVAFGSALSGGIGGALHDDVEFGAADTALALHVASRIDGFAMAATASCGALIFGFLSDSFAFHDTLDLKQQILAALADGIEFGMTLFTGEDTFTAWVMTPETRAMRSYSNYAFNSYAVFQGKLIGAKDDGVFILEGDTDDGQAINSASVRSGLLDFGTRQLKRMSRAYLGYTAEGTLGLRVVTTSPEGKKVEFTYRAVKPPVADAPRETRVKIGKGLESVYWQFELNNNLDGGRFELHDVTVLPITISRKVR